MSANQTLNIRNKEFVLIGLMLIIVAILAALFPNLGANNEGDVDWISVPLVGFPILTSAIMLAFASQEGHKRKHLIAGPIRLACLAFSIIPLGISTALFFDWLIELIGHLVTMSML